MSFPIHVDEGKDTTHLLVGENKLSVHKGDITNLSADAIICPVNQRLDTNSGVAKILLQAAGPVVRNHKPFFPEPFGKVVVLPGKLRCKYIFLTVLLGEHGMEKMKLSIHQAVERSIRYAEFLRIKSVAFPVLGCPDSKPPYDFIARHMMENVILYFRKRHTKIKTILFSAYNTKAYTAFKKEVRDIADL